jgi:hypothetical protein
MVQKHDMHAALPDRNMPNKLVRRRSPEHGCKSGCYQ